MPQQIDPTSPVPLYHQIAEAIRAACESGELKPGDALAPLRKAAEEWGVNVHTVRHAYTSLVREGLVRTERGSSGSRVVDALPAPPSRTQPQASWETFLLETVASAQSRYGVGREALADAVRSLEVGQNPRVYVVECSTWQATFHANELQAEYQVDAAPWVLTDGEPPEGTVVATYFHYNDIRKLWPRRLSAVRFVSIHPEPSSQARLKGLSSVVVCEMDQDTADAVAADLKGVVGPGRPVVRTKVAADPNTLAPRRDKRSVPHFFAPRAWAELSDESRANPHVFELRYTMNPADLTALAAQESWRPSATTSTQRAP